MLDTEYLIHGLNALSRAHSMSYFQDGHRGGAIISAYYFCAENNLEESVPALIRQLLDDRWVNTNLCAPFPEEQARSTLSERILEAMATRAGGLVEAGHNIILPALALKAFRDVPEAVTPSRVDGICKLIESFGPGEFPDSGNDPEIPSVDDSCAFAEFVLREFLGCTHRFDGRGQGWTGHLLTCARAVMDLYQAGVDSTARQAEKDFASYIHRIRMGPQETDKPRGEHAKRSTAPHQKAYWLDPHGDWSLGHAVKYPYGYYGLMCHVRDETLRKECQKAEYRIF